jgi:hypothetical protein
VNRAYYSDTIAGFLRASPDAIIGKLTESSEFPVGPDQVYAWRTEIEILKEILPGKKGAVHFEFAIPRMGRRIDVLLLIGPVIFVVEFKVGAREHSAHGLDQVCDYALDLKNFHETSHERYVAPVLVATESRGATSLIMMTPQNDRLYFPVRTNSRNLLKVIENILAFSDGDDIDPVQWEKGRYCPTPSIVEAAVALYGGHKVEEISRSDATAVNLGETSDAIQQIIRDSRERSRKAICFVTGVPGAGKTLVGLNIATSHIDRKDDLYSVFLSGNGPLVAVLREALARDKVRREKERGNRIPKSAAMSEVKLFVQNVHNFRDEYLKDPGAPKEHVVLFDEAQRAWNLCQTASFMKRKRRHPGFLMSEPEFLISCLDRHPGWAVIVCLVGGGQEINTGEGGISEWIEALNRSFPDWEVHVSPRLSDSEYAAGEAIRMLSTRANVRMNESLHLSVSLRSFRAENVSLLVKQLLDLDLHGARETLKRVEENYPIVLTRDLSKAKEWLRSKARGSERYGIVVSSQAERLKPHAIDVKSPVNPIHWFLDGKEDVRSSYYLEDVATEFHIQGLELDWSCVTWDADFRFSNGGWNHNSFRGSRWQKIKAEERKVYQKNAYRVLLTRARQGMVIFVPPGASDDPTRHPSFYDPTYEYLGKVGFRVLE